MRGNKQVESSIDFFERKIRSALGELDGTVFETIRQVAQEHANRQILSSGIMVLEMLKATTKILLLSCKDVLNLIPSFQRENHRILKDEELDVLSDLYMSQYASYYTDKVVRNCYEAGKRYTGKDMVGEVLNQERIDYVVNEIQGIVTNKINDVKTFNHLRRDDPSVRIARSSMWVSITSALLAVLCTGATIYFTVFYGK